MAELKHIVIVGGGTAGWITAAMLNRTLKPLGVRTTLVESPTVPSIGVGEATVPTLLRFVRFMSFDEAEFMRATSATYKLGIRFFNWIEPEHDYWHPFGICGGLIDGLDMFHFWLNLIRSGGSPAAYETHSLQATLGEAGKAPRPETGSSPVMKTGAYAFHLDAAKLAGYLQNIATGEGVEHLVDEVVDLRLGGDGAIQELILQKQGLLAGDFFIDCTGFAGRLIDSGLKQDWLDWSDQLLCDRAVTMALPVEPAEAFNPYTRATAQEAGWIWRIPLIHRIGTGYVFSSRHCNDDAAAAVLLSQAGADASSAEPRFLKMRVGRRRDFWSKHCVAVGLSAGFLEPLESTGIYLIQRGVELLLDYLPDHGINPALRQAYNQRLGAIYDETRDFILLHYILSRRVDSEFWRDARGVPLPNSLEEFLQIYDEAGRIAPGRASLFGETSLYHILAGAGRLPRRAATHVAGADNAKITDVLKQIRRQNENVAQTLPSHRDLLQRIHNRTR